MDAASVGFYRPYLVNAPLVLDATKSNSDSVMKNMDWFHHLIDSCKNLMPDIYNEEHSMEYYKSEA